MSGIKRWYAENSNPEQLSGQPDDVIEGMDLFIGLSGPGIIKPESLGKMNDDAIVFAMANPNPEVMPEDAAPYVRIMATGRSDYPNQINNVLAFPGIFRGALDAGAPQHHRGDEARRRQGHRDGRHRGRPLRGLHHPQRLQPRSRAEGRRGGGRGGQARGHRPLQRGDRHLLHGGGHLDLVKVLVTGASGFIGSALCDSLLVRGDTVVGLTRDPQRARGTNPSVSWHAWEPTLERPPAAAFEGVDGVVNLLGEKINQRWTDEAKQRIMESRRTGTHNLVGTIAGLEHKPRVLVSQSAIGYYGDRGEAIVDESTDPGEGFDAEVVREWEKAAHEVEATGVRLVVVRTGHVLDPRGGFLEPAADPVQAGRRRPAGRRQPVRLLDPRRRRGRHPALGAGQRQGQRGRSTPLRPIR